MADARPTPAPSGATGVLVLADGSTLWGKGFGAEGEAVGEVCFNTAMTGYQEIMTDPSYARQIVTFTFPHIGNVGANYEDLEADNPWALGCVVRQDVTAPSNFRAIQRFDECMRANGRIGLSGVDTRALTRRIRTGGAPNGVIAHCKDGEFDVEALLEQARAWPGLEGMDLAREVSCRQMYRWSGGRWKLGEGYSERPHDEALDAVRMMTSTPARIAGVADRKGTLAKGKDADIVIFDGKINIETTIIGGKVVHTTAQSASHRRAQAG